MLALALPVLALLILGPGQLPDKLLCSLMVYYQLLMVSYQPLMVSTKP